MSMQYVIAALFLVSVASTLLLTSGVAFAQASESGASGIRSFSVQVDGKSYPVVYLITEGTTFKSVSLDNETKSLDIFLNPSGSGGELQLALPRELMDAKDAEGNDANFAVLVDGKPANVEEFDSDDTRRYLSILFVGGSSQVTITGTQAIPEFPHHIILIASAVVVGIIAISRTGLLLRFYTAYK